MTINKAFKHRIYPNSLQKQQFAKIFGCCRFVYNKCLDLRKSVYASEKRNVSSSECMRYVTALRRSPETVWLAEADSMALQESVKDLGRAYDNFFAKRASFPRFKKKASSSQSYRTRNQGGGIRIEDGKLRLPTINGLVKIKYSRPFEGRILNATVTKTRTDKYFVSLCCEMEFVPKNNSGGLVGIDVGLKSFYTDSNGLCVDAPKPLKELEAKLIREQRKLSRMLVANIKGYTAARKPMYKKPLSECRNIEKQRIKVARIHEKIANIRMDFLHKEALRLADENQVICIEHLNIRGMVRNHRLAKAISDASWSCFFSILEYKAFERGSVVVKVPTFYPSSQVCSSCGFKNPLVKNLSVREWDCLSCGAHHGRDTNAAENILTKGLAMLNA